MLYANDLAEYIKAVIEGLKNTNDAILREVTLQKLSNDYNISYAVLKSQLGEIKNINTKKIIVDEKSEIKKSASSNVMPTAAKTTANLESSVTPPVRTLAWRVIWAARLAWGSPDPEKMGSFCPRTRVFSPSIVEMPV